ncbi:hypothetical protein CHS0354_009920 [Potamilus streckersoni]|uniref:Uncharacterized protein n=1 Tax=Potamilus streckersoni TaxID=2493646 RepID=A0AAE0TCP5_9BIVA|nr:hypothetical protein CHS0354_009920 [Potamilus streckersoni]
MIRGNMYLFITFSGLLVITYPFMIREVAALRCWKCIAHDCDTNPENNYKASITACSENSACMKVRYRMFDNYTHYDSVIRTCSTGICHPTTELAFSTCVGKKNYMIRGCVLRKCCSDQDFCNTGERITAITALLILLYIIYAYIT